jgi:hypothetical protein
VIIEVDLRAVPPGLALLEPDDFTSFTLRARGRHSFIGRETLLALAGDRALDPPWVKQLDTMLAYAASQGWVDEAGATRAHIEYLSDE